MFNRILKVALLIIFVISLISVPDSANAITVEYDKNFFNKIEANYNISYSTKEKSLKVSTAEELMAVAKFVNEGRGNFIGKYIELINNIDFGGSTDYSPIGKNETNSFSGIFDGNGYKISGMIVLRNSDTEGTGYIGEVYAGIFGYVISGEIKNIILDFNSQIVVDSPYYQSSYYLGGIVGYIKDGSIENCINNARISSGCVFGGVAQYSYTGGIAGCSVGTTITKCSNRGRVFSGSSANTTSYSYAGGIVASTDSNIVDGYNIAEVMSTALTNSYAGGIAGKTRGNILKTKNSGKISSSSSSDYSAGGGIAGTSSGDISVSSNSGDVTSRAGRYYISDSNAGGIVGSGNNVSNVSNIGDVSAESADYSSAGGVVGVSNGVISNCYNAENEISSKGLQKGCSYVGNIIATTGVSSFIENCFYANDNTVILNKSNSNVFVETDGAVDGLTSLKMMGDNAKVNMIGFENAKYEGEQIWGFEEEIYPYLLLANDESIGIVPPVAIITPTPTVCVEPTYIPTPTIVIESTVTPTPTFICILPTPPVKKPEKVTNVKVKYSKKKKIADISWKKVKNNATGYEIEMATKLCKCDEQHSFKKIKTVKNFNSVKYKKRNLKKNKTYYFRVRAYNKVNGKTVYGEYGAIKKVGAKKNRVKCK